MPQIFYEATFIYESHLSGQDERFTIYNLSGKRLMETRKQVFESGLFVGAKIGSDTKKFLKPSLIGFVVPPNKIKRIELNAVFVSDDKAKELNKEDEKK